MHPDQIRIVVATWPESLREWWIERAAILEYEANLPRDQAEQMAFLDTLKPNPIRSIGLDYEPPNGGRYMPADWKWK